MKKITSTIFSFMMLGLITQAAWAATLGIYPELSEINVNDQIDLRIEGREFDQSPDFIGVTVSWDPTVLSYIPRNPDVIFRNADFGNGIIDLNPESTEIRSLYAESNDEDGAGSDFLLAELQFTALAPGSTDIVLGTSGGNCLYGCGVRIGGFSGEVLRSTEYTAASVNVVPIPAAVWLFGAGLLGLIGFVRRN